MRRSLVTASVVAVLAAGVLVVRRSPPPQRCAAAPDEATALAARGGRLLVASQSGTATIIDLATGAGTRLALGGELHGAAVSPDGRWGVVPDYGILRGSQFDGNRLHVIDLAGGRVVRTISTGEHRAVHDVEFLPGSSDRVVVTAQRSEEVIEVDIARGVVTAAIPTRGIGSHALTLSHDARTLFTANEESRHVSRLDLASREWKGHVEIGLNPMGIAVRPDGGELWIGTKGDVLKIVDVPRGTVVATLPGFSKIDEIEFTPDGRTVLLSALDDRVIHVVDAPSRRRLGGIIVARPHMIDLTPDGAIAFVTVGRDDVVAVIDVARRCEIVRYPVAASADGVGWGPAVR